MKAPTLAERLSAVRAHLPEVLVGPSALDRLLSVARWLPGDVLTALETRLGPTGDVVDLSIRLTEPDQALQLAGKLPPSPVQAFLRSWAGAPWRSRCAPALWLEFDLDRDPGSALPLPSLCVRLREPVDVPWLVGSLMPQMQGRSLTTRQVRGMRTILERVPANGSLLYAFSMLPRGSQPVRLELFGLSTEQASALIHRTAPSSASAADRSLPLFADIDRFHLSFDLGSAGVLPRIGMEGSYRRLPRREPRWGRLLDRMVSRNLCAGRKRDALLRWTGYERIAREESETEFLVRVLSHVKVVATPDGPPEAKAYLLVQRLARRKATAS